MSTVRVVVLSDASFASASGTGSQTGFAVHMLDGNRNDSIAHYGSKRSPQVSRSVTSRQLHAIVRAYDTAHVTRNMLVEFLQLKVDIESYSDSRTVFDAVAKNSNIAERSPQIGLFLLERCYHRGELKKIGWIQGKDNAADVLTKEIMTQQTYMRK